MKALLNNNLLLKSTLLLYFFSNIQYGQSHAVSNDIVWFISTGYGAQISGIKSEDFISSNVSPVTSLNIGRWFSKEIALSIGYRGVYFRTIADKEKHYYNYFNGRVFLNLNEIFKIKQIFINKLDFRLIAGTGYFNNNYYQRPNICSEVGIHLNYSISEKISLYSETSAVIGWDIYQGDEDILPGILFGINYLIKEL